MAQEQVDSPKEDRLYKKVIVGCGITSAISLTAGIGLAVAIRKGAITDTGDMFALVSMGLIAVGLIALTVVCLHDYP